MKIGLKRNPLKFILQFAYRKLFATFTFKAYKNKKNLLDITAVYKLSILLATKIQSAILTKNRKLVATNELKSNAFSLGVDHWEGIHLIRISTVLRHIHRLCYRQFRDFDSPPDEVCLNLKIISQFSKKISIFGTILE